MIYLDHAATTPIDPEVAETMSELLKNQFGNPSSIHTLGRQTRTLIEQARRSIAGHFKASIGEIYFTSCGTESNNMVLKNTVRDLGVQRIISSKAEHHCVLHTVEYLEKEGVDVVWIDLDEKGIPSNAHLEALLESSDKKTLVSFMHGNNEIGSMIDLDKVAQICEKYGALFHSDTVQTIAHYPINVQETKVHYLSGSAHKFNGPKGIGFVYINGDHVFSPFVHGGAQERNMRAGTENLYGIVGMAKALDIAVEQRTERITHVAEIKQYMKSQLEANIKGVAFNGDTENGLAKVLNVSLPPSPKADLLVMSLDISGICASGGSACSSGAEHESHVIAAIGGDPKRKAMRFSFSHLNTKEEVDKAVAVLMKAFR